jgi:hypothetical protein
MGAPTKINLKNVPNDRKAVEMALYIAKKSESDTKFGAVKLQKIMFAADFTAYLRGQSITNQPYRRLGRGPVMKRYLVLRDQMERNGDACIELRDVGRERPQARLVAKREPDVTIFTNEEKQAIDDALCLLKDMAAMDVANWSHQFPCWDYAADGEEFPYAAILLSNRELTAAEYGYGAEVARMAGI